MPDDGNLPSASHAHEPVTLGFGSQASFEFTQRAARALASSTLVPESFRAWTANKKDKFGPLVENPNAIPNCIIALNMADRMHADPLMVMQNLYVVEGRPSWSAQFVIAAINSCGRFSPLRFDLSPLGDESEIEYDVVFWENRERHTRKAKALVRERTCRAWVKEKSTGDRLDGPEVSIAMAIAEGWLTKNGSKWLTMPEVMLRYRSAALFGRLYAPELLMGLPTADEVSDVIDITPNLAREGEEIQANSETPRRPTRSDFEGEGEEKEDCPPEYGEEPFVFVDSDGSEYETTNPSEWGNRFFTAVRDVNDKLVALGLWETNSPQLQRLRDEMDDGPKFAGMIEQAHEDSLNRIQKALIEKGAASQAETTERRTSSPKEFGKIPRTATGAFDWVKFCHQMGDLIEASGTVEDVIEWQKKNMNPLDLAAKGAPDAYAELQRRIQATTERLGAAKE